MIGTVTIVNVIAVTAVLILAFASFRSHGLGIGRGVQMAAIWGAIIVGLALLIQFVRG